MDGTKAPPVSSTLEGIMNTAPELIIARKAIAKIAIRFPSLTMIEEPTVPVELSIRLPVQPGLNYEVWLALQTTMNFISQSEISGWSGFRVQNHRA